MSDIQLQISGKQIDTIPIINLLRQGENNEDNLGVGNQEGLYQAGKHPCRPRCC